MTEAEPPPDMGIPDLPSEYDEANEREAAELEEALSKHAFDDEVVKTKLTNRWGRVFGGMSERLAKSSTYEAWPPWLYLPSAVANPYSISGRAPPATNRYALAWVTPGSSNSASISTGQMGAFKAARAEEKYVTSQAGLGVLLSPKRTLSVVSLQPTVHCSGESRQLVDYWPSPTEGYTWLKINLSMAAWQQIPGSSPWQFLSQRQVFVREIGPTPPLSAAPIWTFSHSFTGSELATQFLVEAGRTYLLGVVARVSIWSTFTDVKGQPLMHDGNRYKNWGEIACLVPQIAVFEELVYIP